MRGNLDIHFDEDMPVSAVEVVSPDLTTVSRLMLAAGQSKTVPVPSEDSFLRVHLPWGRTVTLTADRGTLSRTISRSMLEQAELGFTIGAAAGDPEAETSFADLQVSSAKRAARAPATAPASPGLKDVPLGGSDTIVRVHGPQSEILDGSPGEDGREATWQLYDTPWIPPYRLEIEHPWGTLETLVPANCRSIYARADRIREGGSLAVSVRPVSREKVADTILNYVSRGDLYSAEAMLEWADEAEALLQGKMQDPYSAAIGAYLLLKLRRFERLHDWTKNLAAWFPFLSDGCVICAWQLIHQDPSQQAEIQKNLLMAAERGLPVYTSGLRMLTDGLRLLQDDSESRSQLERLTSKISSVKWDAPLTTGIRTWKSDKPVSVVYSIEFQPQC